MLTQNFYYSFQFTPLLREAFGEYFLRIVVEEFYKQYIRGGSIPKRMSTSTGNDDDLYIRLRRKTEYGVAVRFAILVRPHADNFYSAIYMWHYFNGYSQLTSLNDRLLITPDIVKIVGKHLITLDWAYGE